MASELEEERKQFNPVHFLRAIVDKGILCQLHASEVRVLWVILRHANLKGQSWLGLQKLSIESGLSRQFVQKAIRNLINRRVIRKKLLKVGNKTRVLLTLKLDSLKSQETLLYSEETNQKELSSNNRLLDSQNAKFDSLTSQESLLDSEEKVKSASQVCHFSKSGSPLSLTSQVCNSTNKLENLTTEERSNEERIYIRKNVFSPNFELPEIPRDLPFKVKDRLKYLKAEIKALQRLGTDDKSRQYAGLTRCELQEKLKTKIEAYLQLIEDFK